MKAKSILKKIRWIIFTLVIALIFVLIIKIFYVPKEKDNDNWDENRKPIVDISSQKVEKYIESLKNQASDIDGYSKYDKILLGLSPKDGYDSDGDGLSDKEEIELYHSNPLKKSTSGDLYDDGYKIAHNMDLNTTFEYEGKQIFKWNECDNIMLNASSANDFSAVVKDITSPADKNIIAKYRVYSFSGTLSIDTSKYSVSNSNISVLIDIQDFNKPESVSYDTDGDMITLHYEFDYTRMYNISIVDKNVADRLLSTFNKNTTLTSKNNSTNTTDQDASDGSGILFGPLFLGLFGPPYVEIWVEDIGENTDLEKQAFIEEVNWNWVGSRNTAITSLDDRRIKVKTKEEIQRRYSILQHLVPFLEYFNDDTIGFGHLAFAFKSLDNEERYNLLLQEKLKNENKPINIDSTDEINPDTEKGIISVDTGFDVNHDVFVFTNFGTYTSPGGNCAGISLYTSTLFNKKSANSSGSATVEEWIETNELDENNEPIEEKVFFGDIYWDISPYSEMQTLMDPGLSDFKDKSFLEPDKVIEYVVNEGTDNEFSYICEIADYDDLSVSEQNFVNMITCYHTEANLITAGALISGVENYSYETIEKMKSYIDNGKVLCVGMNTLGGSGHEIIVYGYEYDEADPDKIYFYVYDCNFPDKGKEQCKLIITRIKSDVGYTDSFVYDYLPESYNDPDYRMTSYVDNNKYFFFDVIDEDLNLLSQRSNGNNSN